MEGRGPGLWKDVDVSGIQWDTMEGVEGDSEMLINVELESNLHKAGLVEDGVADGDSDELETCC